MNAARVPVLASCLVLGGVLPAGGQERELQRVPTRELEVAQPGAAVIRDRATWEVLWRRFETYSVRDGEVVRYPVPHVDFEREMLIAVGIGGLSGCVNERRYVVRVVEHDDSVLVELGFADPLNEITCMMRVHPIDVVRIPRTDRPVRFRSLWTYRGVPPPAPWWDRPSWAELDAMDGPRRGTFLWAIARDPRSTAADLREVAVRAGGGWVAMYLMRHPMILDDPIALVALGRVPSRRQARNLLFERHGRQLAQDTGTTAEALEQLIEVLRRLDPGDGAEVVRPLGAHPTVQGDQELLRAFIFAARYYPDVVQDACAIYTARYPPEPPGQRRWIRAEPCPR